MFKELFSAITTWHRFEWHMALILGLLVMVSLVPSVQAATLNPACNVADLIAALNTANTNGQADIINLPNGCLYTLTSVNNIAPAAEGAGANGLPSILDDNTSGLDLIINGNGATIQRSVGGGTPDFRILHTFSRVELVINNLTVGNGRVNFNGAGVHSGYRGKLTINNCTFNNNNATFNGPDEGGGAIYSKSESDVIINGSTFTGNRGANGGAIGNLLSNLTVINSAFTSNISFRDAFPGGGGGAIYVDGAKELGSNKTGGQITINNSTFAANTGIRQGGAVYVHLYNDDIMTINHSTFTDNSITGTGDQGFGGAIFHTGDTGHTRSIIRNSTFSGNRAFNQGGAIWTGNNANVNLTNLTLTDNRAEDATGTSGLGGGIMVATATIMINNVTVANNHAGFEAGGIRGGINVTLSNSIIANNTANNPWGNKQNCADGNGFQSNPLPYFTNSGNNLQFPVITDSFNNANCTANILQADPLLAPLTNNGGSTQTRALNISSPAINTGNPATCSGLDQRNYTRQGGCDIGAFEFGGAPFVPTDFVYLPLIQK